MSSLDLAGTPFGGRGDASRRSGTTGRSGSRKETLPDRSSSWTQACNPYADKMRRCSCGTTPRPIAPAARSLSRKKYSTARIVSFEGGMLTTVQRPPSRGLCRTASWVLRYYVPLISQYALLRTSEIPISVPAYH